MPSLYDIEASIRQLVVSLLGKLKPQEPQRPDPELAAVIQQSVPVPELAAVIQQSVFKIKNWANIIIGFCFASTLEIALVWAQLHYHLPPIFHFLSLAILFAFTSLLLSKFFNSKFPNTARVLEGASVFFVVTTFFIAISIPFPFYLKLTVWVVYAICLVLVILTLYNC